MADIRKTADFLHLFSEPEGFKFLTHDFDSAGQDYLDYAGRARLALADAESFLPSTLYDLLFGFFYGPSWTDSRGRKHDICCGSGSFFDWCDANPGTHPINSTEYGQELMAFKSSIRIYQTDLGGYMKRLLRKSRYPMLDFVLAGLDEIDCYTDVGHLLEVCDKIVSTMAADRFSSRFSTVKITGRFGSRDGYQTAEIWVEQVGANTDRTASDILHRIADGGGDLASFRTMMEGYFEWSIETCFLGTPLRINILCDEDVQKIEDIPAKTATGFRHIIRIYYKP